MTSLSGQQQELVHATHGDLRDSQDYLLKIKIRKRDTSLPPFIVDQLYICLKDAVLKRTGLSDEELFHKQLTLPKSTGPIPSCCTS